MYAIIKTDTEEQMEILENFFEQNGKAKISNYLNEEDMYELEKATSTYYDLPHICQIIKTIQRL